MGGGGGEFILIPSSYTGVKEGDGTPPEGIGLFPVC